MFAIVILGYILSVSLFLFFAFMVMFYDWRWIKDRHRYAKIPSPKWHFIAGAGLDILRCKDEGKKKRNWKIIIGTVDFNNDLEFNQKNWSISPERYFKINFGIKKQTN